MNTIELITYGWVLDKNLDSSISLLYTIPKEWLDNNFPNLDLENYTHEEGYDIYIQAKQENIIIHTQIEN
ncbi:hypothetical protein QB607_003195 [Clostridium botulinum]|nr:hypothetical protein [Clostridium botulinum]EKS4395868.1 hypothetical protein [Clostridium botulinum]